jgi:hypothetical protein
VPAGGLHLDGAKGHVIVGRFEQPHEFVERIVRQLGDPLQRDRLGLGATAPLRLHAGSLAASALVTREFVSFRTARTLGRGTSAAALVPAWCV